MIISQHMIVEQLRFGATFMDLTMAHQTIYEKAEEHVELAMAALTRIEELVGDEEMCGHRKLSEAKAQRLIIEGHYRMVKLYTHDIYGTSTGREL